MTLARPPATPTCWGVLADRSRDTRERRTRIQALTRHAGVSFNGGHGFVHLRAANADSRVLRSAWEQVVVDVGLGGPLRLRKLGRGVLEGSAPVYHFLPLNTLSAALDAACAGRPLS